MLKGEHTRSQVYASCLGVAKKLTVSILRLKGFKDKNTLCGSIQDLKTRNILHGRYLQNKKQEAT